MSNYSKDSDLIIYPETVIPKLYDDKEDIYENISLTLSKNDFSELIRFKCISNYFC